MVLSVQGLRVAYGHAEALRGVDLEAKGGEITAIIGSNGAGKTSALMAISGLVPVTAGEIRLEGRSILGMKPYEIAQLGIAHVLEGRQLFADQTVEDNLLLGAYTRLPHDRARVAEIMEREMNRFPILQRRRHQFAGNLSGGEQQMLAIARGLMSDPKLILMDEPSMGLAPLVVQEIARILRGLRQEGSTIILVEQMASVALQLADRVYVFENGRIKLSGTGIQLASDPEVKRAYLGG
ncbi:MAG: ABC transporter ATP-binding protein [Acetobacteraceae bacterium]|nr:ABC transporter ATP-binding protein [Acetobacteraceae bacterium]MBV8522054.1 ABC transporter ATP-binding protein [Acetobacteraceae bacterium]